MASVQMTIAILQENTSIEMVRSGPPGGISGRQNEGITIW